MKVLRLAESRLLLWARESDADPGRGAFEVSKVVEGDLQPRCPTAPRCPGEDGRDPFAPRAAWIDPDELPLGRCAYDFRDRGECLEHRNQRALEAALFRPGEADMVRRLLEALGFVVHQEVVDPVARGAQHKILRSHGYLGQRHEVRLLGSPAGGQVVLVREQGRRRQRRERPSTSQARPMGGTP